MSVVILDKKGVPKFTYNLRNAASPGSNHSDQVTTPFANLFNMIGLRYLTGDWPLYKGAGIPNNSGPRTKQQEQYTRDLERRRFSHLL